VPDGGFLGERVVKNRRGTRYACEGGSGLVPAERKRLGSGDRAWGAVRKRLVSGSYGGRCEAHCQQVSEPATGRHAEGRKKDSRLSKIQGV